MKRKDNDRIRGIEETLIAAHRLPQVPGPDDSFVQNVMFAVRGIGRHPLDQGTNGGIEPRAVWRFAAVTGILALIFLFYSLSMDLSGVQYQVAQSIFDDSATLMLTETFAVI